MFIDDALYSRIVRSMPIPCVDLVVMDDAGRIMLVRRKNEPAANQWWFPGGRVLFGELRIEAANRKLKEECGFQPINAPQELGTFDCLLHIGQGKQSHGITTLFKMLVDSSIVAVLDPQSSEAHWGFPSEWQEQDLHPIILAGMALALKHASREPV